MNQRYKFAEMVVLMNTEVNYGAWLLVSILAFHRYRQYIVVHMTLVISINF